MSNRYWELGCCDCGKRWEAEDDGSNEGPATLLCPRCKSCDVQVDGPFEHDALEQDWLEAQLGDIFQQDESQKGEQ